MATRVGGLSAGLGSVANSVTAPLGRSLSVGLQTSFSLSPTVSCYLSSALLSGMNGYLTGGGVGAVTGGVQGYINSGWSGVLQGIQQGWDAGSAEGLRMGLTQGIVNPFICFTAGTPVLAAGGKAPIESLALGRRVLTERTKDAAVQPGEIGTEVDPATWRRVRLRTAKPAGSDNLVEIEYLRPVAWLKECGEEPGAVVPLCLPELSLDGPAEVLAVEDCPAIEPGRGRVVTGTYTTARCPITELRVSGQAEPIRTSALHRFYSEDRNDWVPAEELAEGERLRTACGRPATVESVRLTADVERVYNLEVEFEHQFYAGETGVLVHNSYLTEDKSIAGKSPSRVRRDRPSGWSEEAASSGHGWKMVDENGVERIRYMYPDKGGKFYHEQQGYFRRQSGAGEFLDVHGNVVPESDPLFHVKTHIIPSNV